MVGLLSELRPYHRHRKNNHPRNGYQRQPRHASAAHEQPDRH